ncbi:MAG: hypothetical protein IKM48_03320 [Clostridia bacterium]|nr:hypothetical protein [Clostridia bacterium]
MAEKKRKRDQLLPCICYFPRGDTYVRDTELTPEEIAEAERRGNAALTETMNRYYSDHPEEYHALCQSKMIKEYDAAHPLP